jgi:hypothetical protein
MAETEAPMSTNYSVEGPIIVWEDLGCEGWSPTSFPTIKAALQATHYASGWIITKTVQYTVVEAEETA